MISVIQETTVAIQPMGFGVTLSPAQILDPVNDLVEQFSTLMLLACVSFAIQRVLISIGGYEWVSVVLTVSLLAWTWFAWRAGTAPLWLTKMLLVLLLVRFAVPIAALGSEGAFRLTMSSEYEIAQFAVRTTSDDLRRMSPENPVTSTTTGFEKLKEWWDRKKQDVQIRYEQLRDSAEKLVWHVIALMAVFIVQTLILPLLFSLGGATTLPERPCLVDTNFSGGHVKVVTERTSKWWKALGFASLILLGLGVFVFLSGAWSAGVLVLGSAGAVFFISRVGAWWDHS